ncbi:HAD hydrolase-like protein [Chelatococcus sp. GCM10030263]|uniref:HAD hydrolase-like protein n=1 Tax=Chelatococcus sp. GCM10030263 TaxID=3273387 RepID=UPI00360CA1BB
MSFEPYGGVIFDCDGVLLDSNRIKAEAFRAVVATHPAEAVEMFCAYQQAHPGLHRRQLFAHFFHEILRDPQADAQAERAVSAFAATTLAALQSCPAIPGALELVRRLDAAGLACVVVSAAEAADLELLLQGRGIAGHLKAVRGGDRFKVEQIADLLASCVIARPLLYFGDSRADMEAAEAFAARFVMVSGASDWRDGLDICRARGHVVVPDLLRPDMALFTVDL